VPERGERRLVNIYLNKELYLTAKSDAAKQDITMQEWVEDALRRKLKSDGAEVEQDTGTSQKD
jgi:predicted HicB family RNase H-like nuclease